MDFTGRSPSSVGFPFHSRPASYSGSAATLKEEAIKAMFSSPPHCRKISPGAYTRGLPTVRRRRASPVTSSGPFSPGGCMQHPQWFSGNNRIVAREKVVRIDPQCFV